MLNNFLKTKLSWKTDRQMLIATCKITFKNILGANMQNMEEKNCEKGQL